MKDFALSGAGSVVSYTMSATMKVINGVMTFFIAFVFAIYILMQKETLGRQCLKTIRAFLPEQAVEKYRCFKERLLKELGLLPTEEIEQIHTLALGFCRHRTGDEEDIFRLVCEDAPAKQAFFCSFGVFQNIVALERRHLARSGHISTLVIVSLDGSAPLTTDVRRLERILQEGLRTGDPVARIAAGAYILMLTGANAEHAQVVTNRLACSFHKTYRHSNARLNFRLSALCPDGAVNK